MVIFISQVRYDTLIGDWFNPLLAELAVILSFVIDL